MAPRRPTSARPPPSSGSGSGSGSLRAGPASARCRARAAACAARRAWRPACSGRPHRGRPRPACGRAA
eukprot:637303-Prymnesium_polylepis.1